MKRILILGLILLSCSNLMAEEMLWNIHSELSGYQSPQSVIDLGVKDAINHFLTYNSQKEEMYYQYLLNPEYIAIYIAVGQQESSWRYMRSIKTNNNGSFDIGPMGVNSYNLLSNDYKLKYHPKDNEVLNPDDKMCVLMVTGMKQLQGYYRLIGSDTPKAYNGGIGAYNRKEVPAASERYQVSVYNKLDKVKATIEKYVIKRRIEYYNEQIEIMKQREIFKRNNIIKTITEIPKEDPSNIHSYRKNILVEKLFTLPEKPRRKIIERFIFLVKRQ